MNAVSDVRAAESAVTTPVWIGPVRLGAPVILAPMSGVTDLPFRRLAAKSGAGLVVSEMIASQELSHDKPESRLRMESDGLANPVIQIAGREPRWMAEAARIAEGAGAAIIDINMGCPAKKVTSGYSGSALMRDLDHATRLIEATVAATCRPVTLKMRLGWDDSTINAPELAKRAEATGVQMVTVHGRTRCQFYKGKANWRAIRKVRDAVAVPLIANGDLGAPEEIEAMAAASGANALMVGRASYGRPWLPGYLNAALKGEGQAFLDALPRPTDWIAAHYEAMLAHYGAHVGVRAARKHLGWYLESCGRDAAIGPLAKNPLARNPLAKKKLMTGECPHAVLELIAEVFADTGWIRPAASGQADEAMRRAA